MTNKFPYFLVGTVLLMSCLNCSNDSADTMDDSETIDDSAVVNVDPSYFYTADGSVTITTVPCTLSDGTQTDCYEIVTSSLATDHEMGPWCPDNIEDGEEAGGIWLEGGEVYDVDGAFVENLATFYNDANWLMYDANGDIYVTDTEED